MHEASATELLERMEVALSSAMEIRKALALMESLQARRRPENEGENGDDGDDRPDEEPG